MVGVEEGWVSVCWQRGWQSRVTKGKLGRTGRSGCAGVNAALSCVHRRSRCAWCEWLSARMSGPLARLSGKSPYFTSNSAAFSVCPSTDTCDAWKTPLLPHFPHSRRVNFHLESRIEHYCVLKKIIVLRGIVAPVSRRFQLFHVARR